jgi:hypothetical protein
MAEAARKTGEQDGAGIIAESIIAFFGEGT